MKTYADTSFLTSLYVASDQNHAGALAVVNAWKTPPRLCFTPFAQLELRNALARLEHRRAFTSSDVRACMKLVTQDLAAGVLELVPLHTYEWIQVAQGFIDRITPLTGTRTLDMMHLAIARLNGAQAILSFDKNQRLAAKAAGFAVLPLSI